MHSSPTNSQAPGRNRPGRRRSGTGLVAATLVPAGAAGPAAASAPTAAAGDLAAQPEYYGLAAVHQIGTGTFLNVTNPDWANVRGYAVGHTGGSMTVVLDDVQDPASNGSTTVQLNLGADFSSGTRINLTAGGLTATGGITLGGQTVQSDGTLPTPTTTPVSVSGDTVTVTVAAGSAALITLTP